MAGNGDVGMTLPKLGEHYHCYCPCGGCENFEHCYCGECDAPKTFQDLATARLVPGYQSVPKPRSAKRDLDFDFRFRYTPVLPLDDLMGDRQFIGVIPTTQPHYQALDSHGSPAPCDKGCDAWSHDELCPVHGDQLKVRAQRIEDMIDWMEDHDMALEPWQANAFRAILMADPGSYPWRQGRHS